MDDSDTTERPLTLEEWRIYQRRGIGRCFGLMALRLHLPKSPGVWFVIIGAAAIWLAVAYAAYVPLRPLASIILANLAISIWFLGVSCANLLRISLK
jgi:hypothetical protein